jgi:outer membrane protein W
MVLVMAGTFVAKAETTVTGEVASAGATIDTNQAAISTPVPASIPEPVIAPVPEKPADPVPGIDEAEFSLEGFSIGTRFTQFQLETERKSTFLGHIDKLEAIQDHSPTKVYADWWFYRYLGVELTWDRVEARTHNDDPEGISDGNLVAQGPIASLMARYPNKTRVVPHVGVGMAFMSVKFEEEPWWALGYSSPESYAELGSPSVPRGKTREMLPDDSANGVVITAGLDVRITQHWSADLYWRHMDLDAKMGYRISEEIRDSKSIPLSNMAYGAGVKYLF